jgi:drug/metabolite transporter (DMT)-like permease
VSGAGQTRTGPPGSALALTALLLFAVWSNSFVAIEYLVGGSEPAFDFLSLTVARFLPAAAIGLIYCFVWRRRESLEILRLHWLRLAACGILGVPLYNFALGFGQQLGVPAPIASLTTTLAPLFIMVLAACFLGERQGPASVLGLGVAAAGMWLITTARAGVDAGGHPYAWAVLVTAGAPLSWACYSVLSKPVAGRVAPVVWSYLAMGFGGLLVAPLLPGAVWRRWAVLDAGGWLALEYLTLLCTVLGFALWTWLLRHLPVSAVGLLVFLNPPLTTVSKALLARLAPATFSFSIVPREWLGGAVVLAGLAIGISRRLVVR